MRKNLSRGGLLLAAALLVFSCGPKVDPAPALPDYLSVPTTLEGYKGSGRVTITGGTLNMTALGPETLDAKRQTYQGVQGQVIREDIEAYFTLGQPRGYQESWGVPADYKANGNLSIRQTLTPGTYQMGIDAAAGPRGERADLTLNLPGAQIYVTSSGKLTLARVTRIKTQGALTLFRAEGTYAATMYAIGPGIRDNAPQLSGDFDLLLLSQ